MTAIRKEILNYIDEISDSKLEALQPILMLLADDSVQIETNLTDEERAVIAEGRQEYKKGGFIPLDSLE